VGSNLEENERDDEKRKMEGEINNINQEHIELGTMKTLQFQVYQLVLEKKRSEVTELVTKHITSNHKIITTKSDEKSEVWIYKEGIYKPNGRTSIQKICREILDKAYNTHYKTEITSKIESDTFVEPEEFFDKQNEYPYMIPVQNGLLNLKTLQLKPFSHKIPFFHKIKANYIVGSECPQWELFLRQLGLTENNIETLQEWFGYCLVKNYKYEKSVMLYGPRGRNGKSKLLDVLVALLGDENCSQVSLRQIEDKNNKFILGQLRNKLVNVSAEISKEALQNEGQFKGLTGGDRFTVDQKFKNHVSFKNYAKMIFAANNIPDRKDTSDAFILRWILIKFPYRFLPQNELEAMTEEDRKTTFLQNPELIKELTTDKELNGILQWSVKGLLRLEQNKRFSYDKTMKEVEREWNRESDSSAAFIMDMITDDINSFLPSALIKTIYKDYCRKNNLENVKDKQLFEKLKQLTNANYEVKRVYEYEETMQKRGYSGVNIKKKGEKCQEQISFA